MMKNIWRTLWKLLQCHPAYKWRYQDGHHTDQEWESSSKIWQYTSWSIEVKYRSNRKQAPRFIQKNLRGRTTTNRKEKNLINVSKKDLSKWENHTGTTTPPLPRKVSYWLVLDRMKDSVDSQLRDQQAELHKHRSHPNQIATL